MGYSASLHSRTGDEFVIRPHRFEAFAAKLAEFNWQAPPTTAFDIHTLLWEQGWDNTLKHDDCITVNWWQGEKLHIETDYMIAAMAAGLNPNATIQEIWIGEDDSVWGWYYTGNRAYYCKVQMTVEPPDPYRLYVDACNAENLAPHTHAMWLVHNQPTGPLG